jgi:hypothetical protein
MAYNVPLSSLYASDGNVTYAQGSVLSVGDGSNVRAVGSIIISSTGNVGIGTATTITTGNTLSAFGDASISGNLYVGGTIILRTGLPLVLNDISNQADGLKAVFPLLIDQTAVTGIVDNKDLQVVVNGRMIPPYVTERTYPWINTFINNKGFAVVTTGTTANQLVIYNAPDVGSQISVTQLSISASKQTRSYPYSATTIALGD